MRNLSLSNWSALNVINKNANHWLFNVTYMYSDTPPPPSLVTVSIQINFAESKELKLHFGKMSVNASIIYKNQD